MPLLVAVAVKVMDVPAQTVPDGLAASVTVGVALEVTDTVMVLLVTVFVVAQVAFEVNTTVTC